MVALVIPSSAQRSPTTVPCLPIAAAASRTFARVIFGLRPPLRPRARAAANPARVRSDINSRSNSASAAKMPKTSLPAAVVVSIAAPLAGEHPQADAALGEVVDNIHQMTEVAAEPVKLPHDERVTGTQRLETRVQSGAVIALATSGVAVEIPL